MEGHLMFSIRNQRKLAEELFTGRYLFKRSPDLPDFDRYSRRLQFHGPLVSLLANVSRKNGEVQLVLQEMRGSRLLCRTRDLSEIHSILERRYKPRFPRLPPSAFS